MGCANSSNVVSTTLNESPFFITFLGLTSVGKTSIVEYLTGNYDPNDPPIHTNGIVVNEVCIKQIKYRLFDVSGFQSHTGEWNQCIEQSNCVVYVVDPTGIDAGFAFTKDVIERTSPKIVEKKIPVYFMFNKCKEDTDVKLVHYIFEKYFEGIQCSYGKMYQIGPKIDEMFDWIESVIMHDV